MIGPHIKISVSKSKFLKEAVFAACCELASNENFFLLQKSGDGKFIDVMVTLGATASGSEHGEQELKSVVREFKDTLYEKQLQITLLKNNMKTCEDLVYNALSNPIIFKDNEGDEPLPESIARILEESSGQGEESYLDDILKIAVPWDERNK